MWVLPFFVMIALATTINIHMFAAAYITPVVTLVSTTEKLILKKLLGSCGEVVNYLVKKFAHYDVTAEMDSTVLRYTQLAHMNPIQYTDYVNVNY